MIDVKAIAIITSFLYYLIVVYKVIMFNHLIWLMVSLEFSYAPKYFTYSFLDIVNPTNRVLFFVTLLEHNFINKCAHEMMWFCGETNTTPNQITIFSFGAIREAPS